MTTKTTDSTVAAASSDSDRDLIARHLARIVLRPRVIEIAMSDKRDDRGDASRAATGVEFPFARNIPRRKGIAQTPAEKAASIDAETREALLRAITRSRGWMDAILAGKVASFEDIAAAEGLAERHVRRLAPLAFLSPRLILAIADGDAPAGLTVSRLTQALPHAWSAQKQMLGIL
jgi:site-specific DNA recombinase